MSNMVIGDYTAATTIDGSTHYLLVQPGTSSTAYKKINRNTFLGVTGQPADISTAQNFTNKTLDNTNALTVKDSNLTIQNASSVTKQAVFSSASITAGQTRTFTFPDRSSTLATLGGNQVFTGVLTMTAPVISGGSIDNTTITVDSIAGHTAGTTGSIYGISVASAAIQANSAIKDGIILPKSLLTGTGSSWAWQSWTPTFTTLTVGNGVHASSYIQIGKTVIARLQFTLGSTSSMATGTVTFTLPVTAVALVSNCYLGVIRVNTSTSSPALVYLASTTTGGLKSQLASGTYLAEDNFSATVPGTFGTGSTLSGTFVYEAA